MARVAAMVFALDQRVPDLRPDAVGFEPGTNTEPVQVVYASPRFACLPDDPDTGHPDAHPLSDVDALRRVLVGRLEAFIEPVIEPLRLATHLGRRALWGIGGSVPLVAIAHAHAEEGEPDRGVAEVAELLALAGPLATAPPAVETIEHRGARHLAVRDGACCRAYLRPEGEKCLSCPIRSREDRIAGLIAYLDQEAASLAGRGS
jgi:hypothetical protein